jgi:hypothetical protein
MMVAAQSSGLTPRLAAGAASSRRPANTTKWQAQAATQIAFCVPGSSPKKRPAGTQARAGTVL